MEVLLLQVDTRRVRGAPAPEKEKRRKRVKRCGVGWA